MDQFSSVDVQNLACMLDPNYAHNVKNPRPSSQVVGYSLQEHHSLPPDASVAEDDIEAKETTLEHHKKPNSKGGVLIPSTVIDVQLGLPVPSCSKEAKNRREEEGHKKLPTPKGNDIWAAEEVTEVTANERLKRAKIPSKFDHGAAKDPRCEPVYEVRYKESVGAEDIFLGVDFTKDGSASMCAAIVVYIQLPLVNSAKEVDVLEVEPYCVVFETRNHYKARIVLPDKVVEKKAKATWDGVKKVLSVTLTMDMTDKRIKIV